MNTICFKIRKMALCLSVLASIICFGHLSAQDLYEPNDTFATAKDITPILLTGNGTMAVQGLTITASNDDYYKLVISERSELDVLFLFSPGNGSNDLDAYVYDSNFNQIGSAESGNDNEQMTFNDLAIGTYYIYIYGWGGATNTKHKKRTLNIKKSCEIC